jgi:hypothetical protein
MSEQNTKLPFELFPLKLERHKDAVCAVNVTRDLLSFVMAYRVDDGLGISALFAVDSDSESTPLRELPDYDLLTKGYSIENRGYKASFGPIVFEMKTNKMGEEAKKKLRNNLIEQRLMQLAENDRFLSIAINSAYFKKTNVLPFVYSVTENEYQSQVKHRKAEQDTARRTGEPMPSDLPAPEVLRDAAWYEKQRELTQRLYAGKAFASQHNIQYRNRVLAWMLNNYELGNGDRVDGVHAFFSVVELAEKFGFTKRTVAEKEKEYMERLQDRAGMKRVI